MELITTRGALIGLAIAIFLIIKKINPAYSLLIGAVLGGLIGGASLDSAISMIMEGTRSIVPAALRIMTAGILAGVLIQTGAAMKISERLIEAISEKWALGALALSAMLLTAAGVFVDVTVLTMAPVAMATAQKIGLSTSAVLLAMVGGGKAGNIISPNPNTFILAENFATELTSLMLANVIPAFMGLLATIFLAKKLKGAVPSFEAFPLEEALALPSFFGAVSGPIVAILLLALTGMDPLMALPLGGVVGCLFMGKIKHLNKYMAFGLSQMMPIVILFLGTGAMAGIIQSSMLQADTLYLLSALNLPLFLLAPISGILMAGATASTTAGAAIASAAFAPTLMEAVPAIGAAAMMHAGTTVLDQLPHGTFFHATGGSVHLDMKERLKLVPYEALIGLVMTLASVIVWNI